MQRRGAVGRPGRGARGENALEDRDRAGRALTEVRGHGTQRGITEQWRGKSVTIEYLTKVKIELVVKDGEVDAVISLIIEAARTGEVGDGKIFVSPVSAAVRIRTGDRDEAAL